MIVAMTGHRPEKINRDRVDIEKAISIGLKHIGATYVIQGMASGIDLWSAHVAWDLGLPYECAVPWRTHVPRVADSKLYANALSHADKVTYVLPNENYPGPWVYQRRNEYMVDECDNLLAVWDKTYGGTKNCVDYARKVKRPTWVISPNNLEDGVEWLV